MVLLLLPRLGFAGGKGLIAACPGPHVHPCQPFSASLPLSRLSFGLNPLQSFVGAMGSFLEATVL